MLESLYLLASANPGFATGRRTGLLFAVPNLRAAYSKVNAKGPDPRDYVDFARQDLANGSPQGAINAVAHAKRAIHLSILSFLRVYCLETWAKRRRFPEVLELLSELGAFPTRLVHSLNQRRNLIEHEYEQPSTIEAQELMEVAELFVTLAYRFFRGAVIGAYVGEKGAHTCLEWVLHPPTSAIQVYEVESAYTIPTPDGTVHYNITHGMPRKLRTSIDLAEHRRPEWLPLLDLLVYCTRAEAFQLGTIGAPGMIVPTRISFECTDKRDEQGRRQFIIHQLATAPDSVALDTNP